MIRKRFAISLKQPQIYQNDVSQRHLSLNTSIHLTLPHKYMSLNIQSSSSPPQLIHSIHSIHTHSTVCRVCVAVCSYFFILLSFLLHRITQFVFFFLFYHQLSVYGFEQVNRTYCNIDIDINNERNRPFVSSYTIYWFRVWILLWLDVVFVALCCSFSSFYSSFFFF